FVSDFFLDKVKPGDRFEANGPAGNFHYNRVFHGKKQVFLAGGSGITPFMSMISEVLNSALDRQMHLIYGSRTPQAAIFHSVLEDFAAKHENFTYTLVISEPDPGFEGRTGFIDAQCISDVAGDISGQMFYICGPEVMYDFCLAELEKLKVPARRIRREMFGPRQEIRNEPGWPDTLKGDETFTVNVRGRKEITAISGEPLVVALERAGFRVPVSCRCGECSLCRVKLVSGKVFQARGVLLRYADEKYGYIHSCKSYPISDMEIMLV
ncbi:MAG TPA: iron-sulfur cluster-binding domain-containing protein, partial [Deltaproteobacteria bacterium]|nr:iron-sulfur cluster-binding domain-containing protein [Deltaproteobacteria bacterium]